MTTLYYCLSNSNDDEYELELESSDELDKLLPWKREIKKHYEEVDTGRQLAIFDIIEYAYYAGKHGLPLTAEHQYEGYDFDGYVEPKRLELK